MKKITVMTIVMLLLIAMAVPVFGAEAQAAPAAAPTLIYNGEVQNIGAATPPQNVNSAFPPGVNTPEESPDTTPTPPPSVTEELTLMPLWNI